MQLNGWYKLGNFAQNLSYIQLFVKKRKLNLGGVIEFGNLLEFDEI